MHQQTLPICMGSPLYFTAIFTQGKKSDSQTMQPFIKAVNVLINRESYTRGDDDDDLIFNDASTHRVICV